MKGYTYTYYLSFAGRIASTAREQALQNSRLKDALAFDNEFCFESPLGERIMSLDDFPAESLCPLRCLASLYLRYNPIQQIIHCKVGSDFLTISCGTRFSAGNR